MQGTAFFTSACVPCHQTGCFKWCLINWMSYTLHVDYTDKDLIHHTHKFSYFHHNFYRILVKTVQIMNWINIFVYAIVCVLCIYNSNWVKNNKTFTFGCWIAGRSVLLTFYNVIEKQYYKTRCFHSRWASSGTVDYSASERLTRYSNVLETISKD